MDNQQKITQCTFRSIPRQAKRLEERHISEAIEVERCGMKIGEMAAALLFLIPQLRSSPLKKNRDVDHWLYFFDKALQRITALGYDTIKQSAS